MFLPPSSSNLCEYLRPPSCMYQVHCTNTLVLSGGRPLLHRALKSQFVKCTEHSIIAQAMSLTTLLTDWRHMIPSCLEEFR